ncbi:hypothetical protein [Marinomonas mediterranea]|uniref:Uncharacterized protein n=1 Tax=Marinomonas mediterranea (strain ATCC 700492 / JCM 21426 / NBRC 103028 / MMB-1) TaxID=717774 RepID=F2K3Q6_MARM1|nr:hypothetical protein [Marinomonas mediterranea]ADZ90155.1 hypothetical protein Marme_0880 [Marinomonas mediterranea MMB-1]WCN08219.1 hypothetical protein GV055_04450 [Marinomonas mediterranea]WCN16359.1 hypothetical protein GV053_04460 [Marinomonas mediterranea MMB-1]
MEPIYDRKRQRADINSSLKDQELGLRIFWINGPTDSGKTTLLRYVTRTYKDQVICSGKRFSCSEDDKKNENNFIINFIKELYLVAPKDIEKKIHAGYKSFSRPPLWRVAYGISKMLPYQKVLNSIFDSSIKDANDLEKEIRSTIKPAIIQKKYEKIVLEYLRKESCKKSFSILIIDDITWMDNSSMELFLSIIKKALRENIKLYVFVSYNQDARKNNKNVKESFDNELEEYIQNIDLEHLNLEELSDVFREADIDVSSKILKTIYEKTGGVFGELDFYLRKKKEEIEMLLPLENCFSEEDISHDSFRSEFLKNESIKHFFLLLKQFKSGCNEKILKESVEKISVEAGFEFNKYHYDENIGKLKEVGHLFVEDGIIKCSSKKLEIVERHFKNEGLYSSSLKIISKVLIEISLNDANVNNNYLNIAFSVLKKNDPESVLKKYSDLYHLRSMQYDRREIMISVAESAIESKKITVHLNILADITIKLARINEFKIASELGIKIFTEVRDYQYSFDFLYELIKSTRENGSLVGIRPLKEVYKRGLLISSNMKERVRLKTLFCSALEHLCEYDMIKGLYNEIDREISSLDLCDEDDAYIYATAIRSKGLSKFHSDLDIEYKKAYDLTKLFRHENREKILLKAALANHCGLANYYNGNQDRAKEYFLESFNLLNKVSIYTETPLNNIACSLILMNKNNEAYDYLNRASDVICKPTYQTYSIEINKSINLWKLGEEDLAIDKIKRIIDDKKVPDPMILATANVNYGYFLYRKERYMEAVYKFNNAKNFQYRFLHEEYTNIETDLKNYCLIKEGLADEKDLGDMSILIDDRLKDSTTLPQKKIFRLDTNSLYVD